MSQSSSSQSVSVVGIPLELGAQNVGIEQGPAAFRRQELAAKLGTAGFTVDDHGDLTCRSRAEVPMGDPKLRHLSEIVRVGAEAAALTERLVRHGHRVVALGGDHSINLGVVSGAAAATRGDLGLIYLDAHGDMNTPETTPTGNIHGMHLAALLGFGAEAMVNLHTPGAKIQRQHLLHIGGSDLDQAEIDLMAREQLPHFTLLDQLTSNLAPLFAKIDQLAARVGHVWVSLDLDVIDRAYAPGAGMPNQGGLTYREIAAIATYIGQHTNVIGVDVVEYDPLHDPGHQTAELGIELIAKFLGGRYSWYTNYLAANRTRTSSASSV
jgi:arginase